MTVKSFRATLNEDQRLCILRALADPAIAPNYTQHEHAIRAALGDDGHRNLSASDLRSHLAWLDSRPEPLITLSGERVLVATLTQRGEDVAQGRALEPGVARPRPE